MTNRCSLLCDESEAMQTSTRVSSLFSHVSSSGSVKLSVNVSSDVGHRLRDIAYTERLSESSIVQIALKQMFERTTDAEIGEFLREQGASLRRNT
jgi:predicted transcriptional regulator